MNPLRNEKGFSTILLALMVLLVLTALGIAALQTTQRELRSVTKLKLSTQALYSAESGISIATAELNSISNDVIESHMIGDINPDNPWKDELLDQLKRIQGGTAMSPYIPDQTQFYIGETHYNIQNMRFETTVAFLGTGLDIVCFGVKGSVPVFEIGTLQEFYATNKRVGEDFWPILIITSTGIEGNPAGGLFKYAERNVRIRVQAKPSFVYPEAALTLNGSLTSNGNPQSAIGEGHPDDPTNCDVSDIVGVDDTIFGYTGETGDETKIKKNDEPYPLDAVVKALVAIGEEIVDPPNNPNFDEEKIRWHSGNLTVNNLDGNGILVVIGDFTAGGNIAWNGLIVVTGDFIMNGGGTFTKYIHGSVLVGGNITGNGNPDIYYDCDGILDLWKSSSRFHTMWWQEIKGRL